MTFIEGDIVLAKHRNKNELYAAIFQYDRQVADPLRKQSDAFVSIQGTVLKSDAYLSVSWTIGGITYFSIEEFEFILLDRDRVSTHLSNRHYMLFKEYWVWTGC